MSQILRLAIIAAVLLPLAHFVAATYLRSLRREALEKEWDANPPEGQGEAERASFIEAGMRANERSLRMKVLWLVYVLPLVAFALIIYYIN